MELVNKAKAKFLELDSDQSGYLEAEELDGLITWVLQFHVEKTDVQKDRFKDSVMARIDVNKDGRLDLAEFTDLFAEMLDRYTIHNIATIYALHN